MERIEPTLLVTLILLVPAIQAQDSSVSAGPMWLASQVAPIVPKQLRKLDVSNASKETCNLRQPTFVGLYFVSEPPV
ncbi:MAG: hypothetical protein QOH31_995 [Verrucomicrobiota bacterium]